jgi:hypothetical protein
MRVRWLVASLLLVACSSSSSGPHATVDSVVIAPDSVTLSPGDTETLRASARDASGQTVGGVSIFWSTSDSTKVTVNQRGQLLAIADGSARIAASAENISGFATVTVRAPLVSSVAVSPKVDTIYATSPGRTVTLTATTKDKSGAVLNGQPLIWSTNSGLVTVSNGGVVTATGTAAGSAIVTATSPDSGFPAGSAQVIVWGHIVSVSVTPRDPVLSTSGTLLPNTVQLSAALKDGFGTTVTGQRPLAWSSDNTAVASVDASTGLVTATATSPQATAIKATTPDGAVGVDSVTVFP